MWWISQGAGSKRCKKQGNGLLKSVRNIQSPEKHSCWLCEIRQCSWYIGEYKTRTKACVICWNKKYFGYILFGYGEMVLWINGVRHLAIRSGIRHLLSMGKSCAEKIRKPQGLSAAKILKLEGFTQAYCDAFSICSMNPYKKLIWTQ